MISYRKSDILDRFKKPNIPSDAGFMVKFTVNEEGLIMDMPTIQGVNATLLSKLQNQIFDIIANRLLRNNFQIETWTNGDRYLLRKDANTDLWSGHLEFLKGFKQRFIERGLTDVYFNLKEFCDAYIK